MRNEWLAYVVVGLLAIGAGVAIAGLPDNVSVDATIVPPSTTEDSPATTPPTTPPTTAAPDPTDPPTTTAAPTTVAPTTAAPTTAAPTTTEPDDGLPPRSELFVAAANGANIAGTALQSAEFLESLGYVDVLALNGTVVVDFTVVYFADGFEEAAVRLAGDWDLLPEFVAPLAEAPAVIDLPAETELLVYVGLDRA